MTVVGGHRQDHRFGLFLAVTFAVSWSAWGIPLLLARAGIVDASMPARLYVLGGVGPLIGALVVTARHGGRPAVARLIRAGWRLRAPLQWYAVALFSVDAAGIIGIVVYTLSGGEVLAAPSLTAVPVLLAVGLLVGIMEEYGWRGVALPTLLARHGPLAAALVLGLVWAAWHLPLFLMNGLSFSRWVEMVGAPVALTRYAVTTVSLSILMTWVYRESGNLFVSGILFHAAANTAGDMTTGPYVRAGILEPTIYSTAALALLALPVALRLRSEPSPAIATGTVARE